MGTLYITPTPIGNLEDMTFRAVRILKSVTLIAAEDTRTSRILLQHYEIDTPTTSYHEHNKLTKLDAILEALASGDVALISDAGAPGLSDPGYELIRAAIDAGYPVVPLPGASAVTTALIGSGLPADRFLYIGFLPRKPQAKRRLLADLVREGATLVAFESPNRLLDTLAAIAETMGERAVCVAREVSKRFEEFQRGPVSAVWAHYEAHPPKGEITLVIDGYLPQDEGPWDEDRVRAALTDRLDGGESLNAASKAVAKAAGWRKRDVYTLATDGPDT